MNKVFKKGQMVLYGKKMVKVIEVLRESPEQIVRFENEQGNQFVVQF